MATVVDVGRWIWRSLGRKTFTPLVVGDLWMQRYVNVRMTKLFVQIRDIRVRKNTYIIFITNTNRTNLYEFCVFSNFFPYLRSRNQFIWIVYDIQLEEDFA